MKVQINNQISDLEDSIDDETFEKIKEFKNYLKNTSYKNDANESIPHLNDLNNRLSYFQRFKQAFEKDSDVDPGRLLGLTDGIFGMVMTLLIFGMGLPEVQLLTSGDFILFISSIIPTIGVTLVSFVLLSSFWIYHHQFMKINNLNIPFLWLNIFYLVSISFIPFTTSLIGNYSQFFQSGYIFGINVSLTIVLFLLMYRYAYNRNFLENAPSRYEKKYIFDTFFIIFGLTVIVNFLNFSVSSNFIYLFFLVPIISTFRDIRFTMKQ